MKNITFHQHLLSTKTIGTNYFLFLTKIDDVNYCFYIDRKIKQGYNYPRIISVKYRFDDSIFKDTLIEGEIIRDNDKNWHFLISDLLIYRGANVTSNISTRFNLLFNLVTNYYNKDDTLEICPLKIKKIFSYDEWDDLNTFIPKLNYNCRGLYFYTLNSKCTNYLYLFPRNNNYFQKKIETSNKLESIFDVCKTDRPDIYDLYCLDTDLKRLNYGIACVRSIIISSQLRKIFLDKTTFRMSCEYSQKFKKWIPIKESDKELSNVKDINERIN